MSDTQRTLALSAFHYALVAAAATPPFLALVAYEGSRVHPVLGLAMLGYLAVVVWWVTGQARRRVRGERGSLIDAYLTTGIRSGVIGGGLYVGGVLSPLFIWSAKIALFGPHPHEVALPWEEWAFVWIAAILITVGILLAAVLGGALAIIDRTLVAIAHWAPRTNSR